MDSPKWTCSKQLRVADWGEEDAVVYLSDCGDLHLVADLAKSIIKVLRLQPLSSQSLEVSINTGRLEKIEFDAINRQITQLNSLGLLAQIK